MYLWSCRVRADRLVSLVLLLRQHGRLTAATEALAPPWLRSSLGNRAAAIAARYAESS
jgi:hypothetical protein